MSSAPQPAEEKSYLWFMASALAVTLLAGLPLPFLIAAGYSGQEPWSGRLDGLVQAHGALQLQGWAGLVVAGMGLRMVPRLAGRRPLPSVITGSILALMLAGLLLRTLGQTLAPTWVAGGFLEAGAGAAGAGMAAFAIATASTLVIRRVTRSWGLAAWAAAVWWLVWAALTVRAAALSTAGVIPGNASDASNWVGLLGAVGNVVWAVQSRSVPVFYGRRPPGMLRLAPPLVLFNLGIVAVVVAVLAGGESARLYAPGLAAAGLGMAWLALVAGSIVGTAIRLRPGSRAAASFIVAANLWAIAAGLLMVAGAMLGVASGQPPPVTLRDAAYHAFALGVVTILIVGMAQLVTPVFAIQRAAAASGPTVPHRLVLSTLMLATALRAVAGAANGAISEGLWALLIAMAGSLAWTGLAAFAFAMARSWLRQGRLKTGLVSSALDKRLS